MIPIDYWISFPTLVLARHNIVHSKGSCEYFRCLCFSLVQLFTHLTKRADSLSRNMWHFERIQDGRYRSAWIHPYFLRGKKALCCLMSRHGVPPAKSEIMERLLAGSDNFKMLQTNNPPKQIYPETCIVSSVPAIYHPHQTDLEKQLLTPNLKIGFFPEQKRDYQLSSEGDCSITTSTEFVCSLDDFWAPLPAEKSIHEESSNPSSEEPLDWLQPTLHFSTETQAVLEPTPLRDPSCAKTKYTEPDSVMSQLLEPIYALDDIF
jgi:hypothetical protein